MEQYKTVKRFKNPLISGGVSVILLLIIASVGWVVWSTIWKAIILAIGGETITMLSAETQGHFMKEAVEGTFFWFIISPWVWFTLNLGNYGKNKKTLKQPQAGIRYLLLAILVGMLGFVLFVGMMGIWWEPFNWQVLLRPASEEQALLAIKGWGALNFFTLSVILAQIPLVSLFEKYPFRKHTQDSWASAFGTLFLGLFLALFNWIIFILPSFIPLQTGGQAITGVPFDGWSTAIAWCQLFIFFFLLPAEGMGGYPQKFFTTRQPWAGLIGLVIAISAALVALPLLRTVLTPLAESVGIVPDIAVASFALTIINVLLTWHHHFDDYPSQTLISSTFARNLVQLLIVLVIGTVLGILWIKTLHIWPFGGNDLGLGHPMLGILGGQFVYMMPMLYMNTFFDKWPMAKSERVAE
ncbi:hypothetical protein [Vagococcus zengguangii]|uniref:Uncharacterized protein n=1 Tax=Vagococcus zengguangii TaxID=2571750 RepID=A0A4D7CNZ9_9ENTE|nr:hypothetical protein [Vagococcus zengguangii]QCI85798.1 hypothetical protein FA707_01930 [Vagococcus zengguangii]TLG81739.1 hypothetical protein FE258_00910 [Vagococcus zengguangii]